MSGASDFDLLDKWRDGNNRAGSELFQRHFPAIFRFFRNKVGDAADDLVQQTFLGLIESRDRIRGDSSFRTFLFGVARNKLLMFLRTKVRHERRFDPGRYSVVDAHGHAHDVAVHADQQRLLARAMQHLVVDQQVVLELHYWEELSIAEIAGVLDAPEGTIKARLSRARAALRGHVDRLGARPDLVKSTVDMMDRWLKSLPDVIRSDPSASAPSSSRG